MQAPTAAATIATAAASSSKGDDDALGGAERQTQALFVGRRDGPSMTLTQLERRIVKQVAFYLSTENLIRDDFLRRRMDPQGWLEITLLATFPRMRQLSNEIPIIMAALERSPELDPHIPFETHAGRVRKRHDWARWLPSTAAAAVAAVQRLPNHQDTPLPRASAPWHERSLPESMDATPRRESMAGAAVGSSSPMNPMAAPFLSMGGVVAAGEDIDSSRAARSDTDAAHRVEQPPPATTCSATRGGDGLDLGFGNSGRGSACEASQDLLRSFGGDDGLGIAGAACARVLDAPSSVHCKEPSSETASPESMPAGSWSSDVARGVAASGVGRNAGGVGQLSSDETADLAKEHGGDWSSTSADDQNHVDCSFPSPTTQRSEDQAAARVHEEKMISRAVRGAGHHMRQLEDGAFSLDVRPSPMPMLFASLDVDFVRSLIAAFAVNGGRVLRTLSCCLQARAPRIHVVLAARGTETQLQLALIALALALFHAPALIEVALPNLTSRLPPCMLGWLAPGPRADLLLGVLLACRVSAELGGKIWAVCVPSRVIIASTECGSASSSRVLRSTSYSRR